MKQGFSLTSIPRRLKVEELSAALSERRRGLEFLSIFYLLLPYVIFAASWLKPWVAGIVLIVIIWASRDIILASTQQKLPRLSLPAVRPRMVWAAIAAVLLLWVFFSGVGGFTAQTEDYHKHNAVFNDLSEKQWPVVYENGQGLTYYIGYYLPTAAFAKLAGPEAADYFQFAWMALGVVLAFYWICRLAGRVRLWLALLLVGFSGMDVIGYLLFYQAWPPLGSLNLEWATSPAIGIWQYSSNATLLYWTPQHALAGWIITAMIIAEFVEKKPRKNTFFLYSLSWLVSPMVALWLAPFLLGIVVASYKKWRSFISFQNIVFPLCMVVVIGSYYMTTQYSQPFGPIWEFIDFRSNVVRLLFFHLLEYGMYAVLLFPYIVRRESRQWQIIFGIAVAMLLVMPLVKYGLYNDQLMRGSIPALFIIMVLIARMLSTEGYRIRKIIVSICLVAGAVTPVSEISRHFDIGQPKRDEWMSIENNQLDAGARNLANQYYGDRDSFFYEVLAE